jgi:mediator of RNA polymerase II transcription subunit 7
MFGVSMTNDEAIIRPLESQGIKRLYPRDYDHKRELKKMNASILVNFLDLLDVLVKCPDTSKREEKCSDIAMLFVQMHHLINELRPHQGRETIRVTLQCQKRQRIEIVQRLNKQIDRVHELVTSCVNGIQEPNSQSNTNDLPLTATIKSEPLDDEMHDKQCKLHPATSLIDQLDQLMCSIVDEI